MPGKAITLTAFFHLLKAPAFPGGLMPTHLALTFLPCLTERRRDACLTLLMPERSQHW